jgi:hypothetical protein
VGKLGIKAGMTVALVGAPYQFEDVFGELPEGVCLQSGVHGHPQLVIWFTHSSAELGSKIRRISDLAAGGPLWIAWRKKAALRSIIARKDSKTHIGAPSEQEVRAAGLSAGLVDYKVCAIDKIWSGLLFAPRKNASNT